MIVAVGALIVVGAAGGAASLAARRYPVAVRHTFVSVCTKTAVSVSNGKVSRTKARLYCSRALTCISRRLTLNQFKQVVLNMQSGAPNPHARVLTECEKSAAKSVGV